jgi:glycosyltransferase involved in cell wall biosynthesis
VTEVAITVVSDGSTDRTAEIASRYADQINLIVFGTNRGYGAAIKAAWSESDAELLGFLDADGTCDPQFFARLCATLTAKGADVVLGSRLNADSEMPAVRRLGNVMFASLMSVFASKVVHDTASGMRVVRRTVLPQLLPLPDGMHFTPAMSARVVFGGQLRIIEVPMSYRERQGQSKLRVVRDGVRFTKSILDAAFLYRPSRPLGLLGLMCFAISIGFMVFPAAYYLQHELILEWMIYRFIVSHLLATAGFLLLCASYLSSRIVQITVRSGIRSRCEQWASNFFTSTAFWMAPLASLLIGGLLVVPSFLELVRTGGTYEHWSRFVAMSFFVEIAFILIVTWTMDYSLGLIAGQLAYTETGRGLDAKRTNSERRVS